MLTKNPALVDTNRAQTRPEFQSDLIRSAYFLCLVMLRLPLWLSGPRCFIHLLVFLFSRDAPRSGELQVKPPRKRLLIARRVSASQFSQQGGREVAALLPTVGL